MAKTELDGCGLDIMISDYAVFADEYSASSVMAASDLLLD
jgi:hypothetical protein